VSLRTAHIIGSGPNGLSAAITLAQRGIAVTVYERNSTLGGACSTAEATASGFLNDLGSSVYPLGIASPFFRSLPLEKFGLRWIEPSAPVAHPLDDGTAITLEHRIEDTVTQFGPHDAKAWRRLFTSSIKNWPKLVSDFTRPLLRFPNHPIAMARFGLPALLPADTLARAMFRGEPARALFAGIAAHSVLPLTRVASSATGIVLATAGQATGWPIAAGGAQSITNALAGYLQSLGGKVLLGQEIQHIHDIPNADVTLFDTSVTSLARIAGSVLSSSYLDKLNRFKPGPGIFKIDYALTSPIPWRNPACLRAATVHVGGSLQEIAHSEYDAFYGRHSERPFILLVQPSLFDPTRAPEKRHTAWAYCHVPTGSTLNRTEAIENQISRFAPDFRDTVLARRTSNAEELAAWNPNLLGGDISGGVMTLKQLIARPTIHGYRTCNPTIYLCSSSTSPGGGVHGMCGHLAAEVALADAAKRRLF
jgi:phytoene dehydrogenase-like protein